MTSRVIAKRLSDLPTYGLGYNTGALLYSEEGSNYQIPMTNFLTASKSFDVGFTITSIKEEIVYGGQRLVWTGVYPKTVPSGSAPDTTGGIGSGAWAYSNDSVLRENLRSSEGGSDLVFGLGYWCNSTSEILELTISPDNIQTRGFNSAGDGGDGNWVSTGNTDLNKAGTHDVTTAKVYNAAGVEYQLNIDIAAGAIDPRCNGAFPMSYAEATDTTTDDFVCLGQAINGIFSQLPIPVYIANKNSGYTGYKGITVNVCPGIHRIGKESITPYNFTEYNGGGSARIFIIPGASYTKSITGKFIHMFEHGVDAIVAKYIAGGSTTSWGTVSSQHVGVKGFIVRGDQKPTVSASACTAGCFILAVNPEYWYVSENDVTDVNWCAVGIPASATANDTGGNAFDDVTLDYNYVVPFMATTGRFGNYYGFYLNNNNFHGGRRGVVRCACDWSHVKGGIITNDYNWGAGVDGVRPDYFLVETGNGFSAGDGAYISCNGGLGQTLYPNKGVIYTYGMAANYTGIYSESTNCNFVISKNSFGRGDKSKFMGLNIDALSVFKTTYTWPYVKFESGCFGYYDATGTWNFPATYAQYPSFSPICFNQIGKPSRVESAFLYGGYDFKYGTLNMVDRSTTTADIDLMRGYKTSKDMFNEYGLQINSGTFLLPAHNPTKDSNICVWYYDYTGNFDPRNIYIWLTAAIEGYTTNSNDYIAYASSAIDYGNGYKMAVIKNIRQTSNDGIYNYTPQKGLIINVPSTTPVILKAVECYSGGVPLFPQGCKYTPSTDLSSPFGSATYLENSGGGIFYVGDQIAPWSAVTQTNDWTYGRTLNAYTNATRTIKSGYLVGAARALAFTGSITAIDSSAATTTIAFTSTTAPYVIKGIPLNITGGSSTSYVGTPRILSRVMNNDGTATYQYVVTGIVGSVGDILNIDQTGFTGYICAYDDVISKQYVQFNYGSGSSLASGLQWFVNGSKTATGSLIQSTGGSFTLSGGPLTVNESITATGAITTTQPLTGYSVAVSGNNLRLGYGNTSVGNTQNIQAYTAGVTSVATTTITFTGSSATAGTGTMNVVAGNMNFNGNPVSSKVSVPSSATASGSVGQWASDGTYFYVCIATNTWVRNTIATW